MTTETSLRDGRPTCSERALFAESRELCERAGAAVEQTRTLRSQSQMLRAMSAYTRARAARARASGQSVPRRERSWLAEPRHRPAQGPSAGPRGGVVRARPRRVGAAAAEARPSSERADTPSRGTWAHAAVYASRVIEGGLRNAPATSWTVREIDARDLPGSRGERCLVFEDHATVRRVWDFPADWVALPAAALIRLMERPL